MINGNDLRKEPDYWVEGIQNEIFRQVETYLETNQLSRSQFAEELGVSKGYVSQILNGNANLSMKKLVELLLKIGLGVELKVTPIEEFRKNVHSREKTIPHV